MSIWTSCIYGDLHIDAPRVHRLYTPYVYGLDTVYVHVYVWREKVKSDVEEELT